MHFVPHFFKSFFLPDIQLAGFSRYVFPLVLLPGPRSGFLHLHRYSYYVASYALFLHPRKQINCCLFYSFLGQHRTILALRLKHRSGSCGTASALPKCSIMSGCGTRIVLRGQKPLALCDRCPCFGSLFPPLAALTFAASSIICAFGLASAAPRLPYRHLELCGIAFNLRKTQGNN